MKIRESALFLVTVLLLAGAELAPLKADQTITINGISGEVTDPIKVARPKELIEVKVCPADLINYEYTIEKSEQKLQEGFSIVGVGPVFDLVSGSGTTGIGGEKLDGDLCTEVELADLLRCYKILRSKIGEVPEEVNAIVKLVREAVSRDAISTVNCKTETVQWPEATKKVVGDRSEFNVAYKAQTEELNMLEINRRFLVTKIKDDQLQSVAANADAPENAFLSRLKEELETLEGPIAALKKALDDAREVTVRLGYIMSHNKSPVLSQTFLMPETSTRFTIGVKRRPITPDARKEITEADPAKIQPLQFASTTFENRALHRFNISMGMVGVERSDSKDFEVAPSLSAESTTVYHVRETKRDEVELEAATFLGIYFKSVDNYDPGRPAAWMIMAGSEISASPTDFFLGLGRDSRRGVVFGFGITEYEGVRPGRGWQVGQEVPPITTGADAGKPKISTVPKQKKDTIGAYLFMGFRPSIFKAFLDRRK